MSDAPGRSSSDTSSDTNELFAPEWNQITRSYPAGWHTIEYAECSSRTRASDSSRFGSRSKQVTIMSPMKSAPIRPTARTPTPSRASAAPVFDTAPPGATVISPTGMGCSGEQFVRRQRQWLHEVRDQIEGHLPLRRYRGIDPPYEVRTRRLRATDRNRTRRRLSRNRTERAGLFMVGLSGRQLPQGTWPTNQLVAGVTKPRRPCVERCRRSHVSQKTRSDLGRQTVRPRPVEAILS